MKTLYFEGAGSVPRGEVENCRIRTAFHDDKGNPIYLEICGFEVTKHTSPRYARHTFVGVVDHCHYITDDESESCFASQRYESFEYTKPEILRFVNSLGCSFDSIEILHDLAGYRVHRDGGGCNFGDEYQPNSENTARAIAIKDHFYNLERQEGKQYPNPSLWLDDSDKGLLHLLRHFNGYNRHWCIRCDTDAWQDTMYESALGRYGC